MNLLVRLHMYISRQSFFCLLTQENVDLSCYLYIVILACWLSKTCLRVKRNLVVKVESIRTSRRGRVFTRRLEIVRLRLGYEKFERKYYVNLVCILFFHARE
jgi:hypothetical protein